jgi:hypothetical protein
VVVVRWAIVKTAPWLLHSKKNKKRKVKKSSGRKLACGKQAAATQRKMAT